MKFKGPGSKIENKQKRKIFEDHESDTASVLNGRKVAGSGSSEHAKSDVYNEVYRVECKATGRQSLSIKLEWLEKITREALDTNLTPLLAIRFDEADLAEKDWIAMPRSEFIELTNKEIN